MRRNVLADNWAGVGFGMGGKEAASCHLMC
jgi:hypothetical protein